MRKLTWVLALALVLTSCRFKELCYDHHHEEQETLSLELSLKLDLDVNLDVSDADQTHTKIQIPAHLVVCFYDTVTGALLKKEYVGSHGGPLHVSPGAYRMVVYSFDTEWTWVRGENDINTLEAYTSDITAMTSPLLAHFARKNNTDPTEPVIYTPDHLLVTQKVVEIPPYSTEKFVITITATASTIVETYGFEVTNINGAEYIASAEAFVTNQAFSNFFGRGEKNTKPATIYFPVDVNKEKKTLKTTFNTFGKLPGESQSMLHILITDTEGNIYTITEDITEQFSNPDCIIEIDKPIDIPKPESSSGGIAPTVEDWEEEIHDVPIG